MVVVIPVQSEVYLMCCWCVCWATLKRKAPEMSTKKSSIFCTVTCDFQVEGLGGRVGPSFMTPFACPWYDPWHRWHLRYVREIFSKHTLVMCLGLTVHLEAITKTDGRVCGFLKSACL